MVNLVKNLLNLTIAVVIAVLILQIPVKAQQPVEEISKLHLNIQIDDMAHVTAHVTIKNLASAPLVPGIAEIRLQKVQPFKLWIFSLPFTEKKAVKVENVKVYSEKMKIQTRVEERKDYTVIYYEIWYPIEPGKTMDFTVEYDADLVDKGIFFKTITVPVGADLDIKNLTVTVNSDWKLCYADPPMSGSWRLQLPANHLIFLTAEFTILPLPMLPVRGYVLFWGLLLIAMLVLIAIAVRKRSGKSKEEESEEEHGET